MASLGSRPRDLRVPDEDEVRRRLLRTTTVVFVAFLVAGWVVMTWLTEALNNSIATGIMGTLLLTAYGAVLGFLLWKASQRELALIRTLSIFVGEAPVGVAFLDERGHLVYANPVLERFAGRPLSELLGRPVADFVHPEDHARLAREGERRAKAESSTFELRLLHKDGRVARTLVLALPFFDGERFDGSLAAIVDLTELDSARESAERYRQLAAFALDVITHDLSNAMQAVTSRADLAAVGLKDDHGVARRAVQGVQEAAGRASRLLLEVKQIAAADREMWPKREIHVGDLVDRAVTLAVVPGNTSLQAHLLSEAAGLTIRANDLAALALAKLIEEACEPDSRAKQPPSVAVTASVESATRPTLVLRVTGSRRSVSDADLQTLLAAPRSVADRDTPWRSGVRTALAAAVAEAHGWGIRAVRAEGGAGAAFELHIAL